MSNRRPQQPLNDELRDLEQELASLTLRVADIWNRINPGVTPTSSPLSIGDRVRFNIVGQGCVEGVIVGTMQTSNWNMPRILPHCSNLLAAK
jgi:hypothetical protein